MKKLLILALASAFVAAANADATINWGVTTSTLTNASWNDNNAPGVVGSVFKIDADVGDMAVLTPSGTAPDPQVKTVVTVEATFTAISDYSSLAQLDEDAKTALTVAKDGTNGNKYYYWNGTEWKALSGATPDTSSPVQVTITMDKSVVNTTNVSFKVDGTTLADAETSDTEIELDNVDDVGGLAFAGTGDLTSVAATVTPAYAEYAGTRYETTAAAVAARTTAGDSTDIKLFDQGAGVQLPTDSNKYYYSKTSGDDTVLGVFPSSGAGTAESPYTIGGLDDLKAFQQYVAAGFETQGKSYKQTADIELDAAWEGIGIKGGKDLVNHPAGTSQATIDADIATFIEKAFSGTYDGGNYTISKFQMENSTDYGGLFNSINGATIKNLKVSYKENKLCANSSATGDDTGATFVGVARGSTLSNLTAKATQSVNTVSASKDMGGIVAYLMAGSTVDSCTNELNVASLLTSKARKSGGIALITQDGTGTATIRNCKNSGTVTLANAGGQAGGIVGYVGQSTTIENCENTAAVKMLTHVGNTVTLQGTNKGNATVASYTGVATPGLNFATVDGNVATFFADNALVAENTYKVMATNATATATLTAGDTISFDETLFTPTYAITAGTGYVATSSTEKNLTTWSLISGVPVEVPADTTGGRIEIIVAVPASDTALTAATLINTSNRENGDVLKVLNDDGKYYQWTYNGSTWEGNNVASADEQVVVTRDASTVSLSAGQGVWVTYNPAKPLALNGKTVAAGSTTVSVKSGYNLVAPPPTGAGEYSLASVSGNKIAADDKIVIPGKAAPINCVRRNNAWKVYSVSGNEKPSGMPEGWGGVATGGEYVDAPSIPGGTGFFFVSKEAKDINL